MEAIRFENITKQFGKKVVANKDISFSIESGKIYSLLGENGSGKTSLMNVLAGIYKQDSGRIFINGEEVEINSPRDSYKYKIGMIHQHFKLVDVFTATENVLLGLTKEDYKLFYEDQKMVNGHLIEELMSSNDPEKDKKIKELQREIKEAGRFSLKGAARRIKSICQKYGFEVDP